MSESAPSIFSRIVSREIPADIVWESDEIIAFRDIAPQAPLHILVVPKTEEFVNVSELAATNPALLSRLVSAAQVIASDLANGEFRLIFNSGASAGQTVFHVHAHVLAGGLNEASLV